MESLPDKKKPIIYFYNKAERMLQGAAQQDIKWGFIWNTIIIV